MKPISLAARACARTAVVVVAVALAACIPSFSLTPCDNNDDCRASEICDAENYSCRAPTDGKDIGVLPPADTPVEESQSAQQSSTDRDAGVDDAGANDAGQPDSGQPDSGTPDELCGPCDDGDICLPLSPTKCGSIQEAFGDWTSAVHDGSFGLGVTENQHLSVALPVDVVEVDATSSDVAGFSDFLSVGKAYITWPHGDDGAQVMVPVFYQFEGAALWNVSVIGIRVVDELGDALIENDIEDGFVRSAPRQFATYGATVNASLQQNDRALFLLELTMERSAFPADAAKIELDVTAASPLTAIPTPPLALVDAGVIETDGGAGEIMLTMQNHGETGIITGPRRRPAYVLLNDFGEPLAFGGVGTPFAVGASQSVNVNVERSFVGLATKLLLLPDFAVGPQIELIQRDVVDVGLLVDVEGVVIASAVDPFGGFWIQTDAGKYRGIWAKAAADIVEQRSAGEVVVVTGEIHKSNDVYSLATVDAASMSTTQGIVATDVSLSDLVDDGAAGFRGQLVHLHAACEVVGVVLPLVSVDCGTSDIVIGVQLIDPLPESLFSVSDQIVDITGVFHRTPTGDLLLPLDADGVVLSGTAGGDGGVVDAGSDDAGVLDDGGHTGSPLDAG